MKKKKRRKIKVFNLLIAILVLIAIIILLSFIPKMFVKDFKIKIDNLSIKVGEEFKNEFTATFKDIDVTKNVTVDTNLNKDVAGTYKITYIYQKNNKEYRIVKDIKVIDEKEPVITLKGGNNLIVLIDDEYKEPGYVALDNSDGDITENVTVSGTVDSKKEGEYELTYSVADKSGNKTEIKRIVTVTKDSPLSMNVKDFTLDGLFDSVTLKETKDAGDDYIKSITFAGDSMALYYVINNQISGKQLWHQISITPETALTSPIYINHIDTEKTFVENFRKYEPEIVIMTLGTNSAAYMSAEYFYEKYTELIKDIMKASPNTKLIIQSIPPVDKSFDDKEGSINNDKINKLNYYIGKMCEELNIKFLNSSSAMKDENGACKEGYCRSDDGIHPTEKGSKALIEYAKTHAFEE